jgi:hypothetical protein
MAKSAKKKGAARTAKRATTSKRTAKKAGATARPGTPAVRITTLKVGGQTLKAGRGYQFKQTATGVALMRGNGVTANFTCECSGSGGCKVEIVGGTADCMESGCSGSCGWIVNVPGIAGVRGLAVLRG